MVSRFLFLTVFGACVLFVGSIEAQAPAVTGQPIQVQTSRVGASVSLGGSVVPYREVTLAAQLPGRVEYLAGEEGDQFEEGALLVALDVEGLLAERRSAIAELRDAEAALRNASVQYSRELYAPYSVNKSPGGMGMPTLMDQFVSRPMSGMLGTSAPGFERQAELFDFGTQIDQARTAILRAQSRIDQMDAKLRDARSFAPFDGVIVSKMVEVGDTMQPGQPLYKFADIQYLQIRVEVPSRLMPGLRKGQLLRARLDVGDFDIRVRVAQIFPVADPRRHTVTVKFDVPTNAPAAPGMYANVWVPDPNAQTRDLVVIPTTALVYRGSLPAVYVLDPKSQKYELRVVRIGETVDQDQVTIITGLSAGDMILNNPRNPGGTDWSPGFTPAPTESQPATPQYYIQG